MALIFNTILVLFACFVGLNADGVLKQTHIIFRHGDRAPVNLYPTDPNEGYVWKFGLGQLTDIGKRQQYELGTFLRNRYGDYFTSNPQEIEVRSSDKDRCIASTQVNLAAFFKPKGKWIWNENLDWQPVPIRSQPKIHDWMLNEDAKCKAADAEASGLMETPEGLAYKLKYKEIMDYFAHHGGMVVDDPSSVNDIHGTIFIEKLKNLTIPDWVNRTKWDELDRANNEGFVVKYGSKKTQRLRGGPLLSTLIERMHKRAGQTADDVLPKGYMYSTHDAIIAALTSAIGVFNGRAVPYATTLLVELYHKPDNTDVVRLFYRNTTEHEPFQLKVPGCELDCPIGQFKTLLADVTPTDIEAECNAKPATILGRLAETFSL